MAFGRCESMGCDNYGLLMLYIDNFDFKIRLCKSCYEKLICQNNNIKLELEQPIDIKGENNGKVNLVV